MKRSIALLLAAAMFFSMTTAVFAEDNSVLAVSESVPTVSESVPAASESTPAVSESAPTSNSTPTNSLPSSVPASASTPTASEPTSTPSVSIPSASSAPTSSTSSTPTSSNESIQDNSAVPNELVVPEPMVATATSAKTARIQFLDYNTHQPIAGVFAEIGRSPTDTEYAENPGVPGRPNPSRENNKGEFNYLVSDDVPLSTDANGYTEFNRSPNAESHVEESEFYGLYNIRYAEFPAGYANIAGSKYGESFSGFFTIPDSGTKILYVMPTQKITLHFLDEKTKKPVQGVKFGINRGPTHHEIVMGDTEDALISLDRGAEHISDANGEFQFARSLNDTIFNNKYAISNYRFPKGYEGIVTPQRFIVSSDNPDFTFYVRPAPDNTRFVLNVQFLDARTMKPVEGVRLMPFSYNQYMHEWAGWFPETSDANGKCTFPDILVDTYNCDNYDHPGAMVFPKGYSDIVAGTSLMFTHRDASPLNFTWYVIPDPDHGDTRLYRGPETRCCHR